MNAYIFESSGKIIDSYIGDENGVRIELDTFLKKGKPGRYLLVTRGRAWYNWKLLNQSTNYWWERVDIPEDIPLHLKALGMILT